MPEQRRYSLGSLCTGIGGLDLAAETFFAAETAWCSEVEPGPCRVLEREWPGISNLGDLTVLDWSDVEPVDVLSAGYPCQPFSHAGKRKGRGDERHLWPHVAEAVRVLRPRWVVLENVAGHLSLGFGDVLGDLAEAGFDAEWCVLRASDVGAPHRRARLFIVATDARRDSWTQDDEDRPAPAGGRGGTPADADGAGAGRNGGAVPRAPEADGRAEGDVRSALDGGATTADARGERLDGWPGVEGDGRGAAQRGEAGDHARHGTPAWGQYAPAIERWEHVLGRPAPAPTDRAGRLSAEFVEWMQGFPAGWVDGLSRTQALKALGNACVPQQAYAALRELVHAERSPSEAA